MNLLLRPRHFAAFVLAFAPVLSSYRFIISGVSIADVLMITSSLLIVLTRSQIKRLYFYGTFIALLALVAHLLFVQVLDGFALIGFFRWAKFSILAVFILTCYKNIDHIALTRYLIIGVNINLACLLVQYIGYYGFGSIVIFILPGVPLVNSDVSIEGVRTLLLYDFRPAATFLEPAHLSYYLCFALIFIGSQIKSNRQFLGGILGLLGSFSSFGFLAAIMLVSARLRSIFTLAGEKRTDSRYSGGVRLFGFNYY